MRTAFYCAMVALSVSLAGCPHEPCHVDGKTYPSGKSGIPDSDGCNVCSCEDGKLNCTLVGCAPAEDYCEVDGVVYASGSLNVPAPDGCNTCSCEDGAVVACTEKACGACTVGDKTYPSGESGIPAPDGCNTCSCTDGQLACTEKDCSQGQSCEVDGVTYADGDAVPSGDCNTCGCNDGTVVCTDAECPSSEVACVVGGVEYASGTSGIKDPFSCNECTCSDGQLVCTEINCPEECPPNRVPSTSCARCGPADGCEAVETGCFVVCDDGADAACDEPGHSLCVDNVCRNLCG
jgi:hypothetical protein